MKNPRDLIRAFRSARISLREFVERAAEGTLGLTATLCVLSAPAHPQTHPPAPAHPSTSRVPETYRGIQCRRMARPNPLRRSAPHRAYRAGQPTVGPGLEVIRATKMESEAGSLRPRFPLQIVAIPAYLKS